MLHAPARRTPAHAGSRTNTVSAVHNGYIVSEACQGATLPCGRNNSHKWVGGGLSGRGARLEMHDPAWMEDQSESRPAPVERPASPITARDGRVRPQAGSHVVFRPTAVAKSPPAPAPPPRSPLARSPLAAPP